MPAVTFSVRMEDGSIAILSVGGSVDAHSAPDFDRKMKDVLAKANKVVLDFSRLDYIATAGLGVMIASFNSAKAGGGDVIVSGMSDKVRKVFDTMGFSKVLKSATNVQQAKLLFLN